jgi:hypothetical protein
LSRHYGLTLQTDYALPPFGYAADEGAPDVRIYLNQGTTHVRVPSEPHDIWYRSTSIDPCGRPRVEVRRLSDGAFHFLYADLTQFAVTEGGSVVTASWPETSTLEDTATYLGPVLGFVLRLRGVTCLHAGAVGIGGGAIALVGRAGAGKSTTVATLVRRGLPALTDDLLALAEEPGRFLAQPGPPRLLLWPESAEALWGDPEALPRIVPSWEKRHLDLRESDHTFCSQPTPLRAIYLLGDRQPAMEVPRVESISGTAALVRLVANTYANYLLDSQMRAAEFAVLARLVRDVPIRLITAPDERNKLPQLADAILADFETLSH